MKTKQMMMGAAIIGCITAAAISTVSAQQQDNVYAHPGGRDHVQRMKPNAYPTEARRQTENHFVNERSGFGRDRIDRGAYAHGRDVVRPQYDRTATGYRFSDRASNDERREYVGGDDGARRGDRWVSTRAYSDSGVTAPYRQPTYATGPGAIYAYAPGYGYAPGYAYTPDYAYSGDYGPYEYAPAFGVGIGPIGIGIGPAWAW